MKNDRVEFQAVPSTTSQFTVWVGTNMVGVVTRYAEQTWYARRNDGTSVGQGFSSRNSAGEFLLAEILTKDSLQEVADALKIAPLRILAGWNDGKTEMKVFDTLDAVIEAHGEVFCGAYSEGFAEKIGIELHSEFDSKLKETVYSLAKPLTLEQAVKIVEHVNAEGNYHEFIMRPAWPYEGKK